MNKEGSKMQDINHKLDSKDLVAVQQILSDLGDQYDAQLQVAHKRLSDAEHERNRAAHEVARLSRHKENIAKARKKHKLPAKGVGL
jgi:hypothetical protein